MKSHPFASIKKGLRAALSAVLVTGLCVPLAACQSGAQPQTKVDESDDVRWADFDDGSEMLSIDAPYLTSTADRLTFDVVCDQGTYADAIDPALIALDGAVRDWTIESAERTDDVTLSLTIVRPEGKPNNGASFAYVDVASALLRPRNSMELEKPKVDVSIEEAEQLTAEEINADKGVVWPDYATVVNEDVSAEEAYAVETDAMPAEQEAASDGESAEGDANASDTATEQGPAGPAVYEVAVMFADPTLELDTDTLEVEGTQLTARMQAGSFELPADLSTDDFALSEDSACTVEEVRLVSPTEAEVTIGLPEEGPDALDGEMLTLKAEANESEADVVCSLEVPEPWLALQQSHVNEADGTVVYDATLMNSTDALSQDAVQVRVNGEAVEDFSFAAQGDTGSYAVTLDSASAPHGSVVEVDVAEATDATGRQVEVAEAAVMTNLTDDGRKFADVLESVLDSIDIGELAKAGAKKGLGALAEMGWKMFCENSLGMHEVSNNELMEAVTQVQEQVADLSAQVGYVRNDVLAGQNRSTIDTANSLLARIRTRELQLSDIVRRITQEPNAYAQQDMLMGYIKDKKTIIDELATDLGQLYSVVMNADSSTGHNLIQVYDDLMAQSYNWGLQTFEQRQLFRTNLANIWVNGAQMVMLAYGNSGDHEAYLDELDKQTKNLNTLINQTMVLSADTCLDPVPAPANEEPDPVPGWDESDDWFYNGGIRDTDLNSGWNGDDGGMDEGLSDDEYEHLRMAAIAAGNNPADYEDRLVQQSDSYYGYRADPTASSGTPQKYYCNTTGKWYFVLNGGDTEYAWCRGLAWLTDTWNPDYIVASPFDFYKNKSSVITWGDHYMTTTEAKALVDKLHDGQTMKEELESLGMPAARYLVTSSRYDDKSKVVYTNNDWYMDTFEVALANKAGEGFTKEMQHFDGYKVTVLDGHINWKTEAYDLFVLATDVPTF